MPRCTCLLLLLVIVGLTGCGSLRSPIDQPVDGDLRTDLSALNGWYKSGRPTTAEGVFALSCQAPSPGPDTSFVSMEAQPGGDALALSFYALNADIPFARRMLHGEVNEDGVFESSTRWDACLNPYLFIVLGWDVRRKKTYLALDEHHDLIVGQSQRYLLIGLFVVPFYNTSSSGTIRLERVDREDTP